MRLFAFLMRIKPRHLGGFLFIKETKNRNRAFLTDEFLLRAGWGVRYWGDVCHWLVMCNVCHETAVPRLVRLPAAVAAVRVPACRVGALIGRPGARLSAVGATRRPLAGVSVIG